MIRHSVLRSAVVGVALTFWATACGGTTTDGESTVGALEVPASTTTTLITEGRPRAFTTTSEVLVDPSRPTEPVGTMSDALNERRLNTVIRVPSGVDAAPLIVFSHGLGGSPARFTQLLDSWAAAGYVVAAPQFPLTSDANPEHRTEAGDLANQPGDVSFVIDQMLAANTAAGGPLAGRIDPDRIGAAGLSLGGGTTYGLLYNDCCADDRVDAAIVMAGAVLVYTGTNDFSRELPLLALHGDADLALPYDLGRNAWGEVGGPAWLITLVGGSHAAPFEDFETPWDAMVNEATTAFWDTHLGGDASGLTRMETSVAALGPLAFIESR